MDYKKKEKIRLKKDGLIKGTLILTIAGFITRLIGFFYGICFTIYATGIQTSISRLVARAAANDDKKKTFHHYIILLLYFSLLQKLLTPTNQTTNHKRPIKSLFLKKY